MRQARKGSLVIPVGNGGDFEAPLGAVIDAHCEKVIRDSVKLKALMAM